MPAAASIVSPIQFRPILKEKIWGGTALRTVLNKPVSPGSVVGESWELSGVKDNESVATTEAFAGKSLVEILSGDPHSIVGTVPRYNGFPLLYKFIDAHAKLSIQVHPDDAQARARGWGNLGKTECWYIIDAEPGAQMACGFKNGTSRNDIKDAVASERILPLLNYVHVSPGDVLLVPGRTVHAVLGGVLFYEVQETADITLRLYDWDRLDNDGKPRRLHVKESLEIMDTAWHDYHKIASVVFDRTDVFTHSFLVACRYFALEEFDFRFATEVTLPVKRSFRVITVTSGLVRLLYGDTSCAIHKGETVLIPASLSGIRAAMESGARFLLSSVPDLLSEVVAPLSRNGIPGDAIVRLGGNPATSDLAVLA